MTKTEALQKWFDGFGIKAYPASAVPDDATFPYLTYEPVIAAFGEGEVNCTVNLWYYTSSESIPNAKAEEIGKAVGLGGVRIKCDDGLIWIKRGSPFCQNVAYEQDTSIKRRYINLDIEYIAY